jgi:hypothetical protein
MYIPIYKCKFLCEMVSLIEEGIGINIKSKKQRNWSLFNLMMQVIDFQVIVSITAFKST